MKKATQPVLSTPNAPVLLAATGREVRIKLAAKYQQKMLQAWQESRGGVYEPLLLGFGGSHTDADGTIVIPGLGTDYPGKFRVRVAASATNQVGKELIITNPGLATSTKPTPLPIPNAPALVALKNLDGGFLLPAGTTLDQLEIELS